MLRLFQPMVLQQALELSIQALIILDRFDVVRLDEPLDMQCQQRHREWAVGEYLCCDRLRRSNHFAALAEAGVELLAESLEELDVLGLFARELYEHPCPIIVSRQPRSRVIEHERKDELLYEPEHDEIAETADLV